VQHHGDLNIYEVDKVVGKREIDVPNDSGEGTHKQLQYQVSWKGYPFDPTDESNWVNTEDFYERECIRKYEESVLVPGVAPQ
jgi:hypothetical protein